MHDEEIMIQLERIGTEIGKLEFQRQQTLDQICDIARNNLELQRRIELEISGIEFNLGRIADILERMAPAPETQEDPEEKPKKRTMRWTASQSDDSK